MVLTADRLTLHTWQSSDWTAFHPIATDPEVMRFITGGEPWTEEKIRDFVDGEIRMYDQRGFCRWKLVEKASGEMIGFCGVGFWRDYPDPEIGWWLARRFWRLGLATEAGRVALRDAFERVGLERIVSIAMPANTASTRIMEKLGLTFECEFDANGVRLVRYAIGRADYAAASR